MDEVELVREGPRFFQVIDFKLDIWCDIYRLDRAEINPNHMCFRVAIAKIQCPEPGPGTNIKYPMNVSLLLINRTNKLSTIKGQPKEVMLQIQAVSLVLIVRPPVFPLLIRMVGSPVLLRKF